MVSQVSNAFGGIPRALLYAHGGGRDAGFPSCFSDGSISISEAQARLRGDPRSQAPVLVTRNGRHQREAVDHRRPGRRVAVPRGRGGV